MDKSSIFMAIFNSKLLVITRWYIYLFQPKMDISSPTFHQCCVLRPILSPGGPFPRFSALHYVAMRLLDETPQPLCSAVDFLES